MLRPDYVSADDRWTGSPFAWIRSRPSRQVGAIGEKLVSGWCAAKGLNVLRSPDSDADRIIEGPRIEVKFSTLWESGQYKFQQLRDQHYDAAICLGVSPFHAQCWVIPKSRLMEAWHRGEILTQHGGHSGQDTAWLSIDPLHPPHWLQEYGGTPANAFSTLVGLSAPTGPSGNCC